MNKYYRLIKKILMFEPSFLLAILVHLFIFLIFNFTFFANKKKEDQNFQLGQKKITIPFQLRTQKNVEPIQENKAEAKKIQTKSLSSALGTSLTTDNKIPGNSIEKSHEGSIGFDDSIIDYHEPIYPILALKKGIEGNLNIRLKITSEGLPIETTIIKSSGHMMLDEAVMKATMKWRFKKKAGLNFYFVEKTLVFKIKN